MKLNIGNNNILKNININSKHYRENPTRSGKFIMPDWIFKADMFEVIKQAIQLVKKSENDFNISDERCIELICADYISGCQFQDF